MKTVSQVPLEPKPETMKNYHLHLRGYVGGYDFDSRHVQNVLTANKNKPVDVLIDSLGGSVATALTIASAFRDHGDVHVHFVGMNASAATIASMGAKTITMDSCAMYLVHKCSTEFFQWASLNADQLDQQIQDLAKMKSDLEKIDINVATMYAKRCAKVKGEKKTPEQLLELMKAGGWLNATEAHEWGFVDTITDEAEDEAPVLTDSVASAMAAVGMPIPNVPIQASSQFQKFLAAMMDFFKSGRKNETEGNAHTPEANTNQPQITMKKFPFLAALLLMADAQIALTEGKFSMDEQQLGKLEDALKTGSENADALKAAQTKAAELEAQLKDANEKAAQADSLRSTIEGKDLEIQQLQAKVEELNKQPGDTTTHPHNDGGSQDTTTPMDDFCARLAAAQKLYDMV